MNQPIILVGMMGAGKTAVGRRLAARLGHTFLDCDHELEAKCGAPVSTIFELEGEEGFRKRESEMLEELTLRERVVISTGGGGVIREENRRILSERGTVVYLRAQLQELWHRTRRDKRRPLLQSLDPKQRLSELLEIRRPFYESVAHITVDTGRQPVDSVVRNIIEVLQIELPLLDVKEEATAAFAIGLPHAN